MSKKIFENEEFQKRLKDRTQQMREILADEGDLEGKLCKFSDGQGITRVLEVPENIAHHPMPPEMVTSVLHTLMYSYITDSLATISEVIDGPGWNPITASMSDLMLIRNVITLWGLFEELGFADLMPEMADSSTKRIISQLKTVESIARLSHNKVGNREAHAEIMKLIAEHGGVIKQMADEEGISEEEMKKRVEEDADSLLGGFRL